MNSIYDKDTTYRALAKEAYHLEPDQEKIFVPYSKEKKLNLEL
ncbi:TPA: hypothetical protein ACN4S7_001152 [Staphylococcus aureus]